MSKKKRSSESQRQESNTLWFRAKTYGWGWTPSSWQGWAVLIVYIICVAWEYMAMDAKSDSTSDILLGILPGFILYTLVLLGICYRFGEKPSWRWGKN